MPDADGWLPHDSGLRVPWCHDPDAPGIPLHVDEVGNPVPCNAYCQPDQRIHAQLSYAVDLTRLYTPGETVETIHGRALVLDSHLAPEAPRCPSLPDWHPILTTYRYDPTANLPPYTPTSPP